MHQFAKRHFAPPDARDQFLIAFGVIYVAIGYAYTYAPSSPTIHQSLREALKFIPLDVWGWGWMLSGLFMAAASLTHRVGYAFTVATILPTSWGMAYLVGWLNGDNPRGWLTAILFWAVTLAMVSVARCIDPTPIARRVARSRNDG